MTLNWPPREGLDGPLKEGHLSPRYHWVSLGFGLWHIPGSTDWQFGLMPGLVGKEDANFGWVQLSSTGPASTIFLVLDLAPIRYPQRQWKPRVAFGLKVYNHFINSNYLCKALDILQNLFTVEISFAWLQDLELWLNGWKKEGERREVGGGVRKRL